jgi:hypothetical protein
VVTHHYGQQIVEIVGDATRQSTQCLHLLGLTQVLLKRQSV